jgi:lauroyl/myristoyl acyltransferase
MTFFISIRYLLEFFLFKIIIFLLFPFSKKMSSKIISNAFVFLGKYSKYNKIAKNNCKMVFPNFNEKEITKIINNSWQNLGHNLFELTFLKKLLKDKHKIEIKRVIID